MDAGILFGLSAAALTGVASATNVRTSTPIMGWNSYNYYSCSPTETIIKTNAQGLVGLGFDKLGYKWVTTDCGWNANYRSSAGELVWNPSTFPSGGGKELGDFIHGLGLKFGVYSGGGYYQCGSTAEPASLNHETTDAASFASWGADSLKYDNCYSVSNTTMVDYTSAEAVAPTRFQTMASALAALSREVVFQVCQWGVGTDIGTWASAIANSWRVSNDISNNWASIWRITNEVVPYYKHTGVGAYPDMDMLIVGLNALSYEEERFHFGMWAINKSPLVVGCPMDTALTPAQSLAILGNAEVIAINQDSLGQQARLVRRYSAKGYDIWAGNLSNSRMVVGLANWLNTSNPVTLNLSSVLGVSSASARDVWAAKDLGTLQGTYATTLSGHQLQLLVLSNVVKASTAAKSVGYYTASAATLSGSAAVTTCGTAQCLPSGTKVGWLGLGASAAAVTFSRVTATTAGTKLVGVDFINYDVALESAWSGGTNTRNMSLTVNGGAAQYWAFPISGGDWYDSGRLVLEVSGFVAGTNTVQFKAYTDGTYAPDLVGFELFE